MSTSQLHLKIFEESWGDDCSLVRTYVRGTIVNNLRSIGCVRKGRGDSFIGLFLSDVIVEDQYLDDCSPVGLYISGTIVNRRD